MAELCSDILHNIFHRLPAKNLIELKPVCKSWKRVIEDPLFVKSHTKSAAAGILIRNNYGGKLYCLPIDRLQYYPNRVDFIHMIPVKQFIRPRLTLLVRLPAPSCNGLILISHQNINRSWAIWNPLTQDFHEVPPPLRINTKSATFLVRSCGFGYDEASDDYKVVCVGGVYYRNKANSYHEKPMIYSLKLRCWRVMMKSFPDSDNYLGVGVFLNGGLHWKSRRDDKIFVLHLGTEDHHFVAPPPRPPPTPPYTDQILRHLDNLDAVDGCLMMSYKDAVKRSMDVWVMKDYENKVWTKLFSVVGSDEIPTRVVGYLKSKGQVFWQQGKSCLKWRDLETKCEREITISGDGARDATAYGFCFGQILFPGSLVRLDGTNTVRVGMKRKRKRKKKTEEG